MKYRIILFSSNTAYVGTPLALLSIVKILDTKKYDIRIITKNEYPDYEAEIIKQCDGALCFGVSCITGLPLKTAIKISKMVKEKYPHLPIIWGGWQAITLSDETIKAPYVDYICTGQGERTFCEFVEMIEKKDFKNLANISGLSYKKNGIVIHNAWREPEDLNNFPDFDLNLINWTKYLEIMDFGTRVLRIVTSYGCPYRCGFCCEFNNSKRRWKSLSAERIVNFLNKLRSKVDFDGLIIVDNNFFIYEQRVADFCRGLQENNFKIKFGQVNGRTNNLVKFKEDTWRLLKKTGLYNILIGAESASEETLKFINKDATVEQTYSLSKICQKYGIKLVASTIVGLPTEAYRRDPKKAFDEDFKGILKLYKDLRKLDKNHHLLLFPYAPLPFSVLYDNALKLGFVPPKNLDEWADYELTNVHVPWIPDYGMVKIRMLNHISFITNVNFVYLARSLPFVLRIFISPIMSSAKYFANLRLKYDFLSFPVDRWFLTFGVKVFQKLNKVFRIVNIGG